MQEAQGDAEKNSGDLGSLKAARDEYSYVNTCALFFVKRGFPYVSVLEGVSLRYIHVCTSMRDMLPE